MKFNLIKSILAASFVFVSLAACESSNKGVPKVAKVELKTSEGRIVLELDGEKAPISVKNFLGYVESGHYNGTIFHRVIDGFMIQGGGMDAEMNEKPSSNPIKNESANGLQNAPMTVAMARTNDPDSATAQFFINLVNNSFLNGAPGKHGYAVFGKVVEGEDVVSKIGKVDTHNVGPYENVPSKPITIESATVLP